MNRLSRAAALLTVTLRVARASDCLRPIVRGIVIAGNGNDLIAIAVIAVTHTLVAVAAAIRIRKRRSS